ncbi:Arc family DNA-binding protein [Streptomyces sp. NPDC005775]|uniref:Arc family DNA-binding protein n=1 Tax=Streptomyces sp. NPDC005775 TaxID=3364729 RepID=UPI0036914E31
MDEDKRITLRLPTDLHEWLATQAKSARRSLNSEIVHRLEVERDAAMADAESPSPRFGSSCPAPQESDSSPT